MLNLTLSSHVLDLDAGRPAAGLEITLLEGDRELERAQTDDDGRVGGWSVEIEPGTTLTARFETGAWYASRETHCFYPCVSIDFQPAESGHFHVPLLINRHGYSTYRGS